MEYLIEQKDRFGKWGIIGSFRAWQKSEAIAHGKKAASYGYDIRIAEYGHKTITEKNCEDVPPHKIIAEFNA